MESYLPSYFHNTHLILLQNSLPVGKNLKKRASSNRGNSLMNIILKLLKTTVTIEDKMEDRVEMTDERDRGSDSIEAQ